MRLPLLCAMAYMAYRIAIAFDSLCGYRFAAIRIDLLPAKIILKLEFSIHRSIY